MRNRLNTTRTCISASSTTVKLLTVSTLNSCGRLLSFGIPKYLVECLKDLYQNQTAEVEEMEKWEDGIEIGGKYYNNLRYADDVALLATTEDNLQHLVNDVGKASACFGLSLNTKKTQVMVIGLHTSSINIMYNGAPLEQVNLP